MDTKKTDSAGKSGPAGSVAKKLDFLTALATGKVVARRLWINENSQKDSEGKPTQCSLQVIQRIELPDGASALSSKVVALAQGFDPDIAGQSSVTAIVSMRRDVALKLFGTETKEWHNLEGGDNEGLIVGLNNFGFETAIDVVENTTKNPRQNKQTPKINPRTGEILLSEGKAIYRHTQLVEAGKENKTFLRHDSVIHPELYKEQVYSSSNAIGTVTKDKIFSNTESGGGEEGIGM